VRVVEKAEVSRRLKAARWLRGGTDEKGRPAPLAPEDLAMMEPLRRNGISANAITEIERMVKDARPMELREIRDALDLPTPWFDAPITERERLRSIEAKVDQTLALLQQLVGILTRLADLDGDADEFGLGAFGETVKRLAESAPGGRQAEAGEEPARARHRAG
jgi:hypothetical protein